MLLLQYILLMWVNLVLFKLLLIGKFNYVSKCKQLVIEKLLLTEKSTVVMSYDFSPKFFVAMFLSTLIKTERLGQVIFQWFCLYWCKFYKTFNIPFRISWRYFTFLWSPGQQWKGVAISLILLYHFHPRYRHLDISRTITAESSHSYNHPQKLWHKPPFGSFNIDLLSFRPATCTRQPSEQL